MDLLQWLALTARLFGVSLPSASQAQPRRRADHLDAALFTRALDHVLAMEGGYSEDPYDPGGPTNLGIILSEYARWRGLPLDATHYAALKADLKRLTRDEADRIYRANYWDAAHCADLPPALAVFHFDCAVNQGVTGAARMLQQALRVDVDAIVGPATIAAAWQMPHPEALARYAEARRAHYRSLSTFWRFGRGWLSRVDATLALARSVAADPAFAPSQQENDMTDTDAIPAPTSAPANPKWWGQSMTIWGVIITSLSTVLPVLSPILGLDITAELVQQVGQAVVQFGQAAAGLIGTLLTVWGRVRATQAIGRRQFTLTL